MAWLLPDEKPHNEKIRDFDFSDFSVHVPSIFFLESLNALTTALKRKRLTQNQYDQCLDFFKDLPFTVDTLSSTQITLGIISSLSKEHGLTSYDASYAELALRLKSPLGTLDKELLSACQVKEIQTL
jgi:predicted nucleic acid-binding protein